MLADLLFGPAAKLGEALVGKAHGFEGAQPLRVVGQALAFDLFFRLDDFGDLFEEPGVVLGDRANLFEGEFVAESLGRDAQAVRRRGCEGGAEGVGVVVLTEAGDVDRIESAQAGLERAQRLLHRLGERPADGHGFADRLHRRRQGRFGAGEFLERKARNLGDHIIDGRLEGGRGRAGDVVIKLVERVADGELCCDASDRKAGRLRGQRRRARHPRVHLDDDEAAGVRIHCKLHVRSTGLDADLAHHRDRGVAHDLEFFVGERQRRRHRD